MKKLFLVLFLVTLPLFAQTGQIPAPQVPLTGRIGAGGIFPLFNSGTITMTDQNYTMSYPDSSALIIRVRSSVPLTATRNLIAPQGAGSQCCLGMGFTILNETTGGHSIELIGTSGNGVVIPNGSVMTVVSDGTDYLPAGGGGGGGGTAIPALLVASQPPFNCTPSLPDATACLNAAIQAACAQPPWAGGHSGAVVQLDPGTYNITDTLRMYSTTASPYNCTMVGASPQATIIQWSGNDATKPAIRMIGPASRLADISVNAAAATNKWLTGVAYDGDPAIGISTHGTIDRVHVNCLFNGGDGIQLGKSQLQADMLNLMHPYIENCYSGVSMWNGNVLSINIYAPTIVRNHFGISRGITSNFNVWGGEFDANDINFTMGGGFSVGIHGVRSETSKRQIYTGVGFGGTTPVLIDTYTVASSTQTRIPATGNMTAASNILVLSFTPTALFYPTSYVEGDHITVAGAGAGGAALSATITSVANDNVTATLNHPAATTVTGAVVALDPAQTQAQFIVDMGGPISMTHSMFNDPTGDYFECAYWNFTGNGWAENNPNLPQGTGSCSAFYIGPQNKYNAGVYPATFLPMTGGITIASPFIIPSADGAQNLTITVPNAGGGNPVLSSSTGAINIANLFVQDLAGTGTSILQTDPLGNVSRYTGSLGFGNIVPNPFATISAAIAAGGGPVIVLPTSTDSTPFTNPTNMRIQNFKQNSQGADSLFFRDVSEWGVIDGAVLPYCNTTAGSTAISCGVTFTAADVGKLVWLDQVGPGTYGQVTGTITASTAGLTPGTPNLYAGVTFTDPGDCYSHADGTPNWDTQPYGHIQLDATGLPTGSVAFNNFTGKGCTHPPTQGTIATVGGTVTFSGGSIAHGDLVSTIVSVTAGTQQAVLADAAAVTGQGQGYYGTDAHDTFQAACNGISSGSQFTNGTLTFSGIALISHGIDCNYSGLRILGRAPHGIGSVIVYAGKTPNNMMNGNQRAIGGPIATPLVPNSYILNMAYGGAAKVERIHLIGNTRAMPYGLMLSFGSGCYGKDASGNPTNTDCFLAPGTGYFISQAHVFDEITFNSFWTDVNYNTLGTPRMQSCIFFAGFTGNADFTTMDHIYCYGADTGMDSVNDQATDLKIGKWQSDYSNIGLSIAGGTFIDDYYTEFNRADIVMGSPYWPGGFATGANFKNYGGESSAMDFGGMGAGAYNCYWLNFDNGNLGGGPEWRRPDGITADFVNTTGGGPATTTCVGGVTWNGESPGNVLIPYNFEGGTLTNFAFNGNFVSTQFRFPAGTCAGNCFATGGWGMSSQYLKINSVNTATDITVGNNLADWFTTLVPTPGSSLMSLVAPTLLEVKNRSQVNLGSMNLESVNWGSGSGVGYGTVAYAVCSTGVYPSQSNPPCGSTTYNYQLTCVDSLGNESLPTPAYGNLAGTVSGTSILTNNGGTSPLSQTNYMQIYTWIRSGCARYNIYGDNGVGGVIGFLTSVSSEGYRQTIQLNDYGQWTKDPNHIAPTVNKMGSLLAAGSITSSTMLAVGNPTPLPVLAGTTGSIGGTCGSATPTPTAGQWAITCDASDQLHIISGTGNSIGGGGGGGPSNAWSADTSYSMTTTTGTVANITMVTPTADSNYFLTWQLQQVDTGSGGTCNAGTFGVVLGFTEALSNAPISAQISGRAFNAPGGTNGFAAGTTIDATNYFVGFPFEFTAKGGTAVTLQLSQLVASNCTTGQQFRLRAHLKNW